MKVKELIHNKDFSINNDLIINDNDLQFIVKLNPNEEIENIYYWYDHLTRGSVAVNQIEKSLRDKNWEVFSQYFYDMLTHKCTLPNNIIVFLKSDGTIIGSLKMNEETIKLLDCSEYECG